MKDETTKEKVVDKKLEDRWLEEYAAEEICRENDKVYLCVVCPSGETPDLPFREVAGPDRPLASYNARIDSISQALDKRAAELDAEKEGIEAMKASYSAKLNALDLYWAGAEAEEAADGYLTVYTGFAPSDSEEAIRPVLDGMGCFYLSESAVTADNPPIKLKNDKFVSQFEMLTDMYGRPSYDGFDPTPFISVFFLLFFAFCMGDLGYGLVLLAIGLLLKKIPSFKDMAPLVTTLGIGTVVVGFLFHNFFSMDIAQWEVFAPFRKIFIPSQIAGNDASMILALGVGILHICLAMVVKTIHSTRTKGLAASLGTWGWTLLVVGGVIVAAVSLAGVLDARATKIAVIGLGVISALGIFVFNDPDRNKFANVGMGLWDTYNMVTGLLGDVLSYLRLYALGLAGSMLGMAFNDMGKMILGDGSNVLLWLPFVLLLILGHTLNIAMCALGAFVHPLRLNFLEFFKNAGYEGNGRKFNPLGNNK